jgi:putative DNA primase/helicase
MADLSKVLGGPWSPPQEKRVDDPETQLLNAILEAGLAKPEKPIEIDGKMHRFNSGTKGSKGYDKSGWYIAYPDGVPSGRFGCWRIGIDHVWRCDVGRRLTAIEEMAHARRVAEARAVRDAALERQHQVASETVEKIWTGAQAALPDHPYLVKKGIGVHGARATGDGRLVVPLYDPDGTLSSLQYIAPLQDGKSEKRFHLGGDIAGKFWMVGTMDEPGILYVAEGFATAATIHETTNRPCIVSYGSSNLVSVIGSLREMYGATQDILIVADNDRHGVGKKFADQASAKHGARVIIPPIEGMDANDYAQAGHDLTSLLVQQTGDEVIDKLKVVFGDQLGEDYEAPDELVEGLMTIGSSVVVYGDSNSGKTFWALSVATAIASGTDCYGRKTDPGLVVYLASEAPASIRSRMQAIKKFYGCSLENLAMVPVPMNFYNGDQDAHDVIELVRAIEQIKGKRVRLIIGDTLARMSAGANENSGEDMGPVMARFDQVATATGAAMMIIHHNGKDAAKGARGWSGIRAHIDTEIEVAEKEGIRSVTVTKQRELPSKGETIYFRLEVVEMGISKFGSPSTTCVAVSDEESNATKPHKKPTKHDENVRTLERAWWASGAEERNGLPYVSRSALREMLVNDGMSERTAKNKTEASRSGSIIEQLLNAGTIETLEHGWVVSNEVQASAMLMRKSGQGKCP